MREYSEMDMPIELRTLVQVLIPQLLDGPDETLEILRTQWKLASVGKVEYSGVGFFANFIVPQSAQKVEPLNFCGGDAVIQAKGVTNGAGCVLYVEHGVLSYLEVFTYSDDWPEHPQEVVVNNVQPLSITISSSNYAIKGTSV